MGKRSRTILRFALIFLLACIPVIAQRRSGGAHAYSSSGVAPVYGGGVLIPMKMIGDSDRVLVTGSEMKLIVFGAKRRWHSYPA